ncbi:MAG: GNAT family N-acetyltransferase [Myxococcota bacterium]
MPEGEQVAVRVLSRVRDVAEDQWNACAGDDPFLSFAFLDALEESQSATAEEGWLPHHLAVEREGRLVAAAPLYVKGHSYGEYVFDWSWANAFQRAGQSYYPKLQCCVPFTPVGGHRLLVHPEADAERYAKVLVGAMAELTERMDLSGAHLSFLNRDQWELCGEVGLLQRIGVQYHWHNDGYATYDDFLGALLGRKRKNLRKERKQAAASGVDLVTLTGDEIEPAHWDAFYRFYRNTVDRKWGNAYLTREFFRILGATMPERVVLVMGRHEGDWVAGALNLRSDRAIYGRYWGCRDRYKSLHFEVCYHRAIEFAIAHGLDRVEAGAQGEHKIQRGYVPVETYSAHHLAHPDFRAAVEAFLEREREGVREEIAFLTSQSPYRDDRALAREARRTAGGRLERSSAG